MSDDLRAWLRTTVPAAWSALITWLISLGATYAGLRALEPHMAPWLTRTLLGSNTPPTYPAANPAAR